MPEAKHPTRTFLQLAVDASDQLHALAANGPVSRISFLISCCARDDSGANQELGETSGPRQLNLCGQAPSSSHTS